VYTYSSLDTSHGSNNVLNKVSSVCVAHDLSEEDSWLLVVSVRVLVEESPCLTRNHEGRLLLSRVLNRPAESVWLIDWSAAEVAIDSGGTITLVVGNTSAVGAVDRNLVVVGAKSVAVGVRVREKTTLEHLVN
jgi:hypothetical protein